MVVTTHYQLTLKNAARLAKAVKIPIEEMIQLAEDSESIHPPVRVLLEEKV